MLKIKRITAKNIENIEEVNALYDLAFPHYEQRSHPGRSKILMHKDYHLYYYTDDSTFVGFIGCWKMHDHFYIEHFAITPQLRGQGYGQIVLKQFCRDAQKVILEIDPVIDDMSQKRLSFYQYCGFKHNNYQHVHPCYTSGNQPHELKVLSFPQEIGEQVYQLFNDRLQMIVMNPALL